MQSAADGDRQIVRQHRSAAVALEFAAEARPKNDRAGQGDESADGVYDRGTGEIMEAHAQRREEVAGAAHGRQPAVRTPGPVSDDRIDETGDADAVEQVADETGAADHRARGDRRAGIGKGELENPDGQERDAGGFIGRRRVLQEEPVIADEAVAVAEHERETDGVEQNAAKAGVHDAFHQHVHRLARTAEAGFEHREADLHAEHQERRDQRPHGVDRIDDVGRFDFGGAAVWA